MGRPGFLGSRVGDRNTERAEARPVPGTAPNTLAPYTEWYGAETPETSTGPALSRLLISKQRP